MPGSIQPDPRPKLFGRQQGHKLRQRQQDLIDNRLPQLRVAPGDAELSAPGSLFDPAVSELFLEIGFGGGEHLAAEAAKNPGNGYLGAEPFVNGIAKLLSQIEDQSLDNIRIYPGDARLLLDSLPDQCVTGIFLLYPDPWPKKRHNKRRFVNRENLDQFHRILVPSGFFLFASDIEDYVDWTLFHLSQHGGFTWQAECAEDWRTPPAGWLSTRDDRLVGSASNQRNGRNRPSDANAP